MASAAKTVSRMSLPIILMRLPCPRAYESSAGAPVGRQAGSRPQATSTEHKPCLGRGPVRRRALAAGKGSGWCPVGITTGNAPPQLRSRGGCCGQSGPPAPTTCGLLFTLEPPPAPGAHALTHQSNARKTEKQPRHAHQKAPERKLRLGTDTAGAHTQRCDSRGKGAAPGASALSSASPP